MKATSILLALGVLVLLATAAKAEPITYASDSLNVALDIAKWVWIDIAEDGVVIDVEATYQSAEAVANFTAGANYHAHVTLAFTPPPGKPAGVDMDAGFRNVVATSGDPDPWFYVSGSDDIFCLNWLSAPSGGTVAGEIYVNASNVDITDPAGYYDGGSVLVEINAL